MKRRIVHVVARAVESLEPRRLLATFTVTNTLDAGAGSLRQALASAGASAVADTIRFAIPGAGVKTIRPLSPLPALQPGDTLDASTQPGYAGKPLVELYGSRSSSAGAALNGIQVEPGSVLRGLSIGNFARAGVVVAGTLPGQPVARVEGNYIGLRADGTTAAGNGMAGVQVYGRATIGGRLPAQRNVVSSNQIGIQIGFGSDNSFTPFNGLAIEGNYIGTDFTGTLRRGNFQSGIAGVFYQPGAGRITIGGDVATAGNLIAYNGQNGVSFFTVGSGDITIRRNRITANGLLGIDVNGDGLDLLNPIASSTPSRVNRPVITSISDAGTSWRVGGTLQQVPNHTFTLDFYANAIPDPTGYGEGDTWAASSTAKTSAAGVASFSVLVPKVAGKSLVSATATSSTGTTSEFSNVTVPAKRFGAVRVETFADLNGNGVRDGASETLYPSNVTSWIDLDRDGTRDANEPQQFGSGQFFSGLPVGTFDLRAVVENAATQRITNANAAGVIPATVVDGVTSTVLVGVAPRGPGEIRGTIFHDDLGDGPTSDDQPFMIGSGVPVYLDLDRDGTFDANEPTPQVRGRGTYGFTGLADGEYVVRIVLPNSYRQTYPSGGRTVRVTANTVTAGVDFGVDRVGGQVDLFLFFDANRNGTRDAGEGLLANYSPSYAVDLFNDGLPDPAEFVSGGTLQPDGSRRYLVPLGTHAFRLNDAGVLAPTFPGRTFLATLTNHDQTVRIDVPAIPYARIEAIAYADADGSGTRGGSEQPINNVTVWLDADDDNSVDAGEPSALTSNGIAIFDRLLPGTYNVKVVAPANTRVTSAPVRRTLSAGQSASAEFGLAPIPVTLAVSGIAFDDADADGTRDAGEPALPGRTVYIDRNVNGAFTAGEPTAVTDANGVYRFAGLPVGTHPIRIVTSTGERVAKPTGGTHFVRGDTSTADFAVTRRPLQNSSLNGQFFLDPNGNGVLDEGDSLLTGRRVFLDADNDGVLDADEPTVLSDHSGWFYFTRVFDGRYTLRAVLNAGERYTTPLLTVDLAGAMGGATIGIKS